MISQIVDMELPRHIGHTQILQGEWNRLREDVAGSVHRSIGLSGMRPAQPGNVELYIVLAGTAICRLVDRSYRVGTRSILWLFRGQTAHFTDVTGDFQTWNACFEPRLVDMAGRSAARQTLNESNPEGAFCRRLGAVAMRRLCTQLEDLSSIEGDNEQLNLGLTYLLVSAWAEYQEAEQHTEAADLHPAVQKAASLLRAAADVESLEMLAKRCGTSPSWLSRLFRKQMNMSLVDYRNQYRIERFFDLYQDSHHRNITQAAFEAGFGSYAQFHRVFRRRFGYSPASLRRRTKAD